MNSVIAECESAEQDLSYEQDDSTENRRMQKGAFYTPSDVARFFWNDYFNRHNITGKKTAKAFIKRNYFIEPSAGAGILFFVFIEKLLALGLRRDEMAEIEATLIDVEIKSIQFMKQQIESISRFIGLSSQNIRLQNEDFLIYAIPVHRKKNFFFGNPPFVSHGGNSGIWNNTFASFLSHALDLLKRDGGIYFILPLALSFSNHYKTLRLRLREEGYSVNLLNFDNIPDTLFSSGKPRHTNTNKANSQRCSFFMCTHASKFHLASSRLIRWKKHEREHIFSTQHPCLDVTDYHFDDQFPRPYTADVLDYIATAPTSITLSDFFHQNGKYRLAVATVARNFIGIREDISSGAHILSFDKMSMFYMTFLAIISPLFMSYWLTTGDGFHLTKSTLTTFPISAEFSDYLHDNIKSAQQLWADREKFAKFKMNAGIRIKTFDYSNAYLSPFSHVKFALV